MLVVIFLAFLIVVVSFISAYLSMKDFQDFPEEKLGYSLFLIRNLSFFNKAFLDHLREKTLNHATLISFERLFKGKKTALVVYGPKTLLEQYADELALLELEDYHDKLSKKDLFCWEVTPMRGKREDIFASFLKVYLKDDEQILLQFVLEPLKIGKNFQVTGRVGVVAEDSSRRADIAKEVDNLLLTKASFRKKKTGRKTIQVYDAFKKRALVPKEVSKSDLSSQEITEIMQ